MEIKISMPESLGALGPWFRGLGRAFLDGALMAGFLYWQDPKDFNLENGWKTLAWAFALAGGKSMYRYMQQSPFPLEDLKLTPALSDLIKLEMERRLGAPQLQQPQPHQPHQSDDSSPSSPSPRGHGTSL